MVSIIISSLNTPQTFISLPDISPNFSHKSITAYWTFLPDKSSLISESKLRTFRGKKPKKPKPKPKNLLFLLTFWVWITILQTLNSGTTLSSLYLASH